MSQKSGGRPAPRSAPPPSPERAAADPVEATDRDATPEAGAWRAPRWLVAVELLRERFFRFALVGALALAATYGLCLLIPETFKATASVIIDPALLATQNEDEAQYNLLSVPTVQRFLAQRDNAGRVKQLAALADRLDGAAPPPRPPASIETPQDDASLIEEAYAKLPPEDRAALAERAADFADAPVEGVLKSLASTPSIEKKLAFDVVYSPVIFLDAKADSPALARALANAWAVSFVESFERLSQAQLRENAGVVKAEHERSLAAWRETLNEIEQIEVESSLPVLKTRYEEQRARYQEIYGRAVETEINLKIARERLRALRGQIVFLTDEQGVWIGGANTFEDAPGDESHQPSEAPAPLGAGATSDEREDAQTDEISRDLREDALASRRGLMAASKALKEFEEKNPLEALRARKESATLRLGTAKERLTELAATVPARQAALLQMESRLAGTSRTLRLERVPPGLMMGGEIDPDAPREPYFEEEINPEWQSLAETVAKSRDELATLAPEAEGYKKLVDSLEAELETLQRDIALYDQRQRLLASARERAEERNDQLRDRFQELRLELFDTSGEVTSHTLALSELKRQREAVKAESDADYRTIRDAEKKVEVLETIAAYRRQQAEALQKRLQDLQMRLSEESREVRVASLAIAPEEKIFPPKALFSLLGAILAALIDFAILFLKRDVAARRAAG